MQSINTNHSKKDVFWNIYWAVGAKVLNLLSALIAGIFVARFLGPEKYGILQYIISYVTIFNILANFGLPNINIRELSKDDSDPEVIIGTTVILRLYLSLITLVIISITLFITEKDKEIIVFVLIYSLSIFANALLPIQNYFTARLKNKIIIRAEIFRTLVGSLLKIALVLLKSQLLLFIIVFAFDFFIFFIVLLIIFNKGNDINIWKYKKEYAKYLIKESFPLMLSGIAIVVYNEIDKVMIRNMLSIENVGYYAVAGKIVVLILFIPQVIVQTITPVLVKAKEVGNYHKIRQMFMDYMIWGALLGSLVICLSSGVIIRTLYGKEYLATIPVLVVLSWKGFLSSLWQSSGHLIIVDNIQKYAALRNILGAILNVGLNFFFIPRFGILGAAWATLISLSFAGIFSHLIIKPYFYLFKLEVNSLSFGLFRILNRIKYRLFK